MNRSVKASLLFTLILLIILYLTQKIVDFGVRVSSYSHYYKVNLIMQKKVDPEIAVFGSSVGEVGINTPVLETNTGLSSYNFSIDGTRFNQYWGLISEFNQNSRSCKLVILTETFFSLAATDQLMEVDRYIAHLKNDNIYQSLCGIDPVLSWKLRHVPFYKFIVMKHSYYKASAMGLMNWFFRNEAFQYDSLKGYTPKYLYWDPGLDELNKRTSSIHIRIDSAIVRRYQETLNRLRQKGRYVLVVFPPIHEDGLRLLPDMNAIRKTFASLEGDGVYFIDYSGGAISKDKGFFYNNSHLNTKGAQKFSAQLANDINRLMNNQRQ